jgi:ABC-type multidrug transport system ATPase subunit
VDRQLEPGRPVALRQAFERGEAERRLHVRRRLRSAAVIAQNADELVNVLDGLAGDLLDRLERRSRALGIFLAQKPGGAGLHEDDVDRVAGGVVEVAGDPGALLGSGQAAFAFRLALSPQGALLERGHALAPQPRAVAREPRRRPDDGSEKELGREPVPDEMGSEQDHDAGHQRDGPGAGAHLVAALGNRVEGDREADRGAEAVPKSVEGCSCSCHEGKDGKGRETARCDGQCGQRGEGAAEHVEVAIGAVEAAVGEQAQREREDGAGDAGVDQELSAPDGPHGLEKVARQGASRVAPGEDPRPPEEDMELPPSGRCGRRALVRTVDGMDDGLVIETSELTKRYGERILAVNRLNLRVRRGEVYGFLGPNGAGKTTTLRMLLGLVRPTSGTARVLGAAPGSPGALARVGALVETPSLYPFLSGGDNLRALARHARVSETRIDNVLKEVQLSDRASDRFATYSLGMKQRLGVAAALLKDPELLILDEPTNGMDPAGMAEMRTFIRSLGRGRRTVLLSSHLMNEVEQICDRVGVIRGGTLVGEGTVAELRGRESLLMRAEPVAVAERLLATLPAVERVTVVDGGLHIAADPAAASAINKALVEAGIAVSELRREQASLEQVFLELTQPTEEAA